MSDSIGAFAMWLAVGLGSLGLFFGPIGKALGRWIESRTHKQAGAGDHRIGELEARLAELEERMDFSERVLAKQRVEERLPGGQ